LTDHPERFTVIVQLLMDASTKDFYCDIGHNCALCLKSMALNEISFVRRPVRKVSQEEGLATSDEETTISSTEKVTY